MLQQITDRFLRYVQIDTTSNPTTNEAPSTQKQFDLAHILVQELQAIGIKNAHVDHFGCVYAHIESNLDNSSNIPTICFCSHIDTSPDCSGTNVKPILHYNYNGQDIVLPDDESIILKLAEHTDLANQIGNTIITASGKTLLGADNKAGIAAIMEACTQLQQNSSIKHGKIAILFTPDEEVGRGTENVDIAKIGADFAYTVDGESLGTIENETFCANGAVLTIFGQSAHPGFAEGKMESALKIAAQIISQIPAAISPEYTSEKLGFIHPTDINGDVEMAKIELIIRDFEENGLIHLTKVLSKITENVLKNYPKSTYTLEIKEQYRNMKVVLDQKPEVIQLATKAMEAVGLKPTLRSIRGGTDGSRLSFMGLPTANIFAGEHAFHSKYEWVSAQDMEKACETIIKICELAINKNNYE